MRPFRICLFTLLLPLNTWAACSGIINGQSATHTIEISDGGCGYNDLMIQVHRMNGLDGSVGNDPDQLEPLSKSCVLNEKGLLCKRSGGTILSGVVYRWTKDTNPNCPGVRLGSRLTCVSGCKAAPKYLYSSPYEC